LARRQTERLERRLQRARAEVKTREPGFNQRANSFQANPNKSKHNSLDFLDFIRPNRDFSLNPADCAGRLLGGRREDAST
jgi:hypothetical protein